MKPIQRTGQIDIEHRDAFVYRCPECGVEIISLYRKQIESNIAKHKEKHGGKQDAGRN